MRILIFLIITGFLNQSCTNYRKELTESEVQEIILSTTLLSQETEVPGPLDLILAEENYSNPTSNNCDPNQPGPVNSNSIPNLLQDFISPANNLPDS